MKLYYYTGHEYLRDILQKKRVKLSRFGKFGTLNDPFELAPYDISDPGLRSAHKASIEETAKKAGLICLSETRCSPAMWAHYTNNHEGACLEFEVTFDHVTKVEYQDQKLFQGITLEKFDSLLDEDQVEKFFSRKSCDWAYEKEHRMIVPLDNELVVREGERQFLPFHEVADRIFMLKRVFVGYRCSKGIWNLMDDVSSYPHRVEVIQTRPAFKTFEVRKQRDKKHWNWDESERGNERFLPAVRAVFG